MDKIDSLIKKHLISNAAGAGLKRSRRCPSEAELSAYLQGLVSKEKNDSISRHISRCLFCLDLIEQASRRHMSIRETGPSKELIKQAKAIAEKQAPVGFRQFKKHLWLIGTIISFSLSFILPKYFLQFLILTLILGIKWALDTANTRTLIMIQESWRNKHRDRDKDNQENPAKKSSS